MPETYCLIPDDGAVSYTGTLAELEKYLVDQAYIEDADLSEFHPLADPEGPTAGRVLRMAALVWVYESSEISLRLAGAGA